MRVEADTPVREDTRKLLDNGWTVLLFRNQSDTYTAVARRAGQTWRQAKDTPRQITDARTPEDALSNLVAKLLFNRHAADPTSDGVPRFVVLRNGRETAIDRGQLRAAYVERGGLDGARFVDTATMGTSHASPFPGEEGCCVYCLTRPLKD
jgi:hypothetical protein